MARFERKTNTKTYRSYRGPQTSTSFYVLLRLYSQKFNGNFMYNRKFDSSKFQPIRY